MKLHKGSIILDNALWRIYDANTTVHEQRTKFFFRDTAPHCGCSVENTERAERIPEMLSLRRRTIALLTSVCVVGGSMLGAAHVAQATTGPTYSRPATFKVNSKFAQQFVGQYLLKSLPAAARVQSAALGIEVGSNGFLYGIGQFYGYDKSGSQTSWVFQLYHFHQLGKGNMMIDLLSPTLTVLLGHLYVGAPVHNNISGLLELNNHRYPVVFHRITTR